MTELRIQDARYERAEVGAIRALQFEKLKRVMDAAWATNPFYRDHWKEAGVEPSMIRSLEDFTARVPTVSKATFMADQAREPPYVRRFSHVLGKGLPLTVCTTSGTTGQGVDVHGFTRAEAAIGIEAYAYLFRWAGLKPGDPAFLNFPITMLGGGRIELLGMEGYGLTVFCVGNYDVKRKLELMERFRPKCILSTTSYLGHLSAASAQSPPPGGVEILMGAGEGAGFSWFERLQDEWQARIVNQFGSTQSRTDHMFTCERGIGTRERPGMLHNIDPYFLLEVIDPATGRQVKDGEAGEIVITSLFHTDIPLVRCGMRDRAVYREPRYCPCGRPFSGVEIATIGRMDDMKKVKGVNIWPQAVDDLMFHMDSVDEYQIVLTSGKDAVDVATARIMPKTELAPGARDAFAAELGRRLRERIGIRFEIELVPLGTLARSEYKARRWVDERLHKQ